MLGIGCGGRYIRVKGSDALHSSSSFASIKTTTRLTDIYRRLTIILDRPESIREEDIDAPLPESTQELDLPQSADNIANLQASIGLTRIFNNVVR